MPQSGNKRVVVTGLGMVTSLGNDLSSTWNALQNGQSGISPVTRFDPTGCERQSAAEVKQFDPRPYLRVPKALKLADLKTRLAVAAAAMAVADAGLTESNAEFERLGVLVGAGSSDFQVEDIARAIGPDPELKSFKNISFFARQILSGLNPLWLLINLPNMVSAHVAIQLQAHGPNNTVMTDWVAGAQAIGEASCWIRNNDAQVVLAGGADARVAPMTFASYAQGGMFDGGIDGHSTGFVIGEGAAILALEERQHALQRGARMYGELRSYATASSPFGNSGTGAVSVTMQRALTEAEWQPEDLSVICLASVFSSPHWETEREALRKLFRRPLETLPLIEFKSRIGHTLSASGAIELALLLKSLEETAKPARALCNSLGFGGQAATLGVSANWG